MVVITLFEAITISLGSARLRREMPSLQQTGGDLKDLKVRLQR